MTTKNILVPVDGSSYSAKALRKATEIAEKNESKIIILTCLRKEDVGAWYVQPKFNKDVMTKAKKFAKKFLIKLEEDLQKKGISASSSVIETKSLVEGITKFANSKKVDLIVMGSHGRTGFKKVLLGSVSNGVVQHAKQPVLIVK